MYICEQPQYLRRGAHGAAPPEIYETTNSTCRHMITTSLQTIDMGEIHANGPSDFFD